MNILAGIYFILSLTFNSASFPAVDYDYSIDLKLHKTNVFHVEVEKLRQAGKEFINSDIYYNYRLGSFGTSLRWLHNSGRDIDIYQLDVRWYYAKHLNVGGAIVWENGTPTRKLLTGVNYNTTIKFFLIPLNAEVRSDVFTGDFKTYSHSEKVIVTFDLISLLGLYFDLSIEDFNMINWESTLGLKINL